MQANGEEGVERREFCEGERKMSLEGFYYRRLSGGIRWLTAEW